MQALVLHKTLPDFFVAKSTTEVALKDFGVVAYVAGHDETDASRFLEVVFDSTNHIDDAWWNNSNVTLLAEPKQRSTSVGDLVMVDDGEGKRIWYLCAGMGWQAVSVS